MSTKKILIQYTMDIKAAIGTLLIKGRFLIKDSTKT